MTDDNHKWTKVIRQNGIVEAVCEHFAGHPIQESVDQMEKVLPGHQWGVHGCDGCCSRDDFPKTIEELNQHIGDFHSKNVDDEGDH